MTEDFTGLLDAEFLKTLLPFHPKSCLVLKRELMADKKIPLGTSKLGGAPDLPKDAVLPADDDYECTFVGQINFAEASKSRFASVFPDQGLLSIFLLESDDEEPDVECIYSPATAELTRRRLPESVTTSSPVRLSFHDWLTIPCFYPLQLPTSTLEEQDALFEESERYGKLTQALLGERHARFYPEPPDIEMDIDPEDYIPPMHQMLGHHYDMNGTERPSSDKWLLLLQVSSDDATESSFIDMGDLYLWIKEEDLLQRRFDKIDLEIQS